MITSEILVNPQESLLSTLLEYLQTHFEEYPYSENKDPKYFLQLVEEFSELNIFEELKQYHAWVLDQSEEKKIFYRSRFRTWLKTARGFKERPYFRSTWRR